jgi:hypothetical protein
MEKNEEECEKDEEERFFMLGNLFNKKTSSQNSSFVFK